MADKRTDAERSAPYADYLDFDARFGFGPLRGGGGTTRSRIRKDPKRALALAHMITDVVDEMVAERTRLSPTPSTEAGQ